MPSTKKAERFQRSLLQFWAVGFLFLGEHFLAAEAFAPSGRKFPNTNYNSIERISGYNGGEHPARLNGRGISQFLNRQPPSSSSTTRTTTLNMLPPDQIISGGGDMMTTTLPSFLTAFSIFPGSSVVDPVVVSNAFWDGITRQFVSLIIGNILAVIGFSFLTTYASDQMTSLSTFVSEKVFGGTSNKGPGLRQPPPGYDGSYRVTPDFNKLALCIAIDVIGSSSGLIPLIGELTDFIWAPIAALSLRSLYGSNVVFALEFAEEILLFTDILPLATIW